MSVFLERATHLFFLYFNLKHYCFSFALFMEVYFPLLCCEGWRSGAPVSQVKQHLVERYVASGQETKLQLLGREAGKNEHILQYTNICLFYRHFLCTWITVGKKNSNKWNWFKISVLEYPTFKCSINIPSNLRCNSYPSGGTRAAELRMFDTSSCLLPILHAVN